MDKFIKNKMDSLWSKGGVQIFATPYELEFVNTNTASIEDFVEYLKERYRVDDSVIYRWCENIDEDYCCYC